MAPYGGTSHQRSVRNGRVAKEGRNILREWKRQNDYVKFLRGEKEPEDVPSDDDGQPQAEEKVVRRGGVVDQDELLKLAAELGMEADGDEEEGEEDDDLPGATDLAA